MTLEDHVGDVLWKARAHEGIAPEAVAKTAGVSEADLATIEQSGNVPSGFDYSAAARLLKLDAVKLARIAHGWVPAEHDLGRWRELRQITTNDGGMAVNCYLVWDEVTREAALFDTGWNADRIRREIEEHQLQLRHVFVTHSHHDHIAALGDLRQRYPKLRVHTSAKTAPVEQRNRANDFIQLGSLRITNRSTPGHCEDGTTYVVGMWPEDAPHVAIVGDAIFAGSMGRGNQSAVLAREKVREQILTLPPETLLCPGHGPVSTVAEERANNPFF